MKNIGTILISLAIIILLIGIITPLNFIICILSAIILAIIGVIAFIGNKN
ncbi:MAG: hypothetical protein IKQ44_00575 [Lachnospiraceae bacterium]|nr:hypothetical protein [Lachnospiraceae bacterium]